MLRTGEDPSVYKWELEQLLEKADPNLAKSALLSRQFMRGLSSSIRRKLLAHANLKRNAEFCPTVSSDWRPRRPCKYKHKRINTQADSRHGLTRGFNDRTGNSTESAWRPSGHFVAVICRSNQAKRTSTTESFVFRCGKQGRIARECPSSSQRQDRSNVQCYECGRYGHFVRECGNYAPLNFQGQSQGTTGR
jgi:Tfp pilus assembly protein PilW